MKFDVFLHPAFYDDFRGSPFILYDVGAAGGIYPLFPDERSELWCAYGFEPTPASFVLLRDRYASSKNISVYEIALADREGAADFYFFRSVMTNSSLYPNQLMYEDGLAEFETIEVRCDLLDNFCKNSPPPDFIKLDTEGSELAVLRGAEKALKRECLGVISELKFLPFASATTCFADLDILLRKNGFILFDIQMARCTKSVGNRFGGKKGPIDSAYVLYFRDFYRLYNEGLSRDTGKARSKLLKILALTVRFLYLDYAAELIDFGRSEKLLTTAEAELLFNRLCGTADLAWRIPNFPGKAKLALLFDYISYLLQPEMKLAVPPMSNNLGNRRSTFIKQRAPDDVRLLYPMRCLSDPSQMDLQIRVR